ncbi:putative multidrug export ATP-binding/permease protein YgaD [Chloroflexota bacterium]|nr:putative multidrug export ATP-binding/permease protein YgaD [Chloroflexota bacterium]
MCHFGYGAGSPPVLANIQLQVSARANRGAGCETGAGKSTLVKLVQRFHDVSSGAVCIDGVDVRSITQRSLRRQMGVVLQDRSCFSGSVRENIVYGKPLADNSEVEDVRAQSARTISLARCPMAMTPRWAKAAQFFPAGSASWFHSRVLCWQIHAF